MATGTTAAGKAPLGRVWFEIQGDDQALAVHVDRQGFRRLLQTLEQLAETSQLQTFERSGRGRRKAVQAATAEPPSIDKLIFCLEEDGAK